MFLFTGLGTAAFLVLAAPIPLLGVQRGQDTAVQFASTPAPNVQPQLERPAQLAVRAVPLKAGLSMLGIMSGVNMMFSPSLLPGAKIVDCACESVTVGEALEVMLSGTGLRYIEVAGHVVITLPPRVRRVLDLGPEYAVTVSLAGTGNGEVLSLLPLRDLPQEGTITGRVVDERSLGPLETVQIYISGTDMGALTSTNGRYLLVNVPTGAHELRAERIGYRTASKEVIVRPGATTEADFELREEVLSLDQIVVTGTAGAARRREIGNSIAQINVDQIPEPVVSTDALIQSRVAGAIVTQTHAQVGGGASIRLRGNVSATMSNHPLIYVDGIRVRGEGFPKNRFPTGWSGDSDNSQYSPLNDIDPTQIERIEIIRGPAATTLYGTEAAAGVIQIFTKRGRPGRARWSLNVDQSFHRLPKFGPTQGFDGKPLVIPPNEVSSYGTPDYMYMEPWLDTGWRQKYALSVTGGLEDLQYFVSGGWTDDEGVYPNDQMKQFNVRGNVSFSPIEGLKLQWNTGYSRSRLGKTPEGGTVASVFLSASRREKNYYGSTDPEKISQGLQMDLRNFIDHLVTGVTATYSPTASLTNRLTVGYDLAMQENRIVEPFGFFFTPKGRMHDTRWNGRTLTFDYVGSWVLRLSDPLNSTVSWGGQSIATEESSTSAMGQDFPGPGEPTVSSAAKTFGFEARHRVINAGFFAQNVFDYNGRYFLTFGIRADGNSAFGSNLGLQAYPKVSMSYVLSDEPFWNAAWGTVKLRAAYGHAGRAPGAFDAVRTWTPQSFGGGVAFVPNNTGNPDLGPERTSEVEFGFDASVLDERLTLELTHYNRRTDDALFSVRQPPTGGGWGSQLKNVGKLKSSGIELSANAVLVRRSSYRWDVGGSVSTVHSEVVDLGGATEFSMGNYGWIIEGQPVPVMRADCITNPSERADPVIQRACTIGPNIPTLMVIGHTGVDLPAGIFLSVRGEYRRGHYAYSWMDGESITRGIRWPSCFNSYPAIDAKNVSELTARERAMCISTNAKRDWAVFPLDFFRVRDVTLSAPLPLRIAGVSSARIFLSAQNFFTWKKAKDSFLDPETTAGWLGDDLVAMNAKVHQVGGGIGLPATYTVSLALSF